jgi:uroporphyrin-III C-methyltransferase
VPGVTTAFAAAASIKQPLTKRGIARNVAFFTSTTGRDEQDHAALPECDTLIQYMGGQEAIDTACRLIAHGKSPDTPVIVIENASRKDERVSRLSLAEMVHGLSTGEGPVLVMIGEALRSRSDV